MAVEKPLDQHTATTSAKSSETDQDLKNKQQGSLEEDDEFEDFPVDDWTPNECELAQHPTGTNVANTAGMNENALAEETGAAGAVPQHLWEESWDDDDTTDDFSRQLSEEIKKVEAAKNRQD